MLKLPPLVAIGFGEGPAPYRRPPASVEIAPMTAGRISACAMIDRMGVDDPWTDERFRRSLAVHGRYGVVALSGPHARVVAYAVVAIDDEKKTATVVRFATDENMRRRGVMKEIFRRIADDAAYTEHRRVEVPVPETDATPRRFLQAIGFRGTGVSRGYYGDRDAYLLSRAVEGVCLGK